MRRFLGRLAVLFGILSGICWSPAAAQDPALLTLDGIYGEKEFEPEKFTARWMPDGSGYTTIEDSKDPEDAKDIVRYDPESGRREVLVSALHLVPAPDAAPLSIDGYSFSKDTARVLIYTNSQRVWRQKTRGDYWVLDRASRELRKLGGNAQPSTLMFAKFSPNGRQVAYVREKNIYLEDLHNESIIALTKTDSPDIINGAFDWVYEEELGLRHGFRWSPDGKSIAYWQLDTSEVREITLVNNTDSLYPQITRIKYPKVGEKNPASRIGVVNIQSRETQWLDVPGDPRNHYIARMDWVPEPQSGPNEIILQQLNRLQNQNRVMLADPQSGEARTILTEKDEAWLDVHDELEWLADGERFTWISERDQWRHVYSAPRSGGNPKLLTPGDFDVMRLLHVPGTERTDAKADEKAEAGNAWLYFLASPENPTQQYLYRGRLGGSGIERITPDGQSGTHDYQISPDARWAIHRWSTFESPPTTELISLPAHKQIRVLAGNEELREKLQALEMPPAEFFRVEIEDDVFLDAWCIKPPDFDAGKRYPVLVFVYGEPAGRTVLDRWGTRHHPWHLMLAQQGYLIMSFDNRGTPAPRGRGWRKFVYRNIGILAPKDQAAALRAVLKNRPYIDSNRIGVWGWSGGGSMSLNAIFKYPDLYKTAIAVAPVANQRYYDTIYQERYMGLPSDNVEGFTQGSPINFAQQLEGKLLLIHGTGDDNVHYQGTEALINELILHDKPFSMMSYPNRTHAIREGKNTMLHLRRLMTRYLREHLPPGPMEP